MRIVIVGDGKIGSALAEQLRAKGMRSPLLTAVRHRCSGRSRIWIF